MPAILTLVSEIFGNLRLFREKVIVRVIRNFRVTTFGVTLVTAQHPLCIVGHGQSVREKRGGA